MKISASLAVLFAGRRSALPVALLLFSAVILVSASAVKADTIYTIQNYPDYYNDYFAPLHQDTVTGNITLPTSEGFQTYETGNLPSDISVTLAMTGPNSITYQITNATAYVTGSLTFTSDSVTLQSDSILHISGYSGDPQIHGDMTWNLYGGGQFGGNANNNVTGPITGDPDIDNLDPKGPIRLYSNYSHRPRARNAYASGLGTAGTWSSLSSSA
jgi:hypothetical protein